jgi:hypothetical protein
MLSKKLLSEQQLEEYDETGLLIVESLFSPQEVEDLRNRMHDQLMGMGIDHHRILDKTVECSEGIRKKSKVAKIYYSKWKMDAHLDERIYGVMRELLVSTYGNDEKKNYENPFESFDDIIPHIDRICWRLPDNVLAEGGLGLHIDRNPWDPYLKGSKNGLKKWRPIQAILVLTGGLQVVSGFHNETNDYFSVDSPNYAQSYEIMKQGGEFYRMNSKTHAKIEKRLQPVNAPRGSLICWDNRLPHATTPRLSGPDTRECVFIGYLPKIPLNLRYCEQQLGNIIKNIPPSGQSDDSGEKSDRDWEVDDLSKLQKKLLGFN